MMWRDTVDLVTVTWEQSEYGEKVAGAESSRTVFANQKSVRQSEVYQAAAVGMKPEVTFEIRAEEYQGETKVSHNGTTYYVIRTFSKNGEILELICSRSPGGVVE